MTTDPVLPQHPDDFAQAIESITPEICAALRRAVEIGRWPDGRRLTPDQRAQSMQAVIAWESAYLPPEARSGYMEDQCRTATAPPADRKIASDRTGEA